MVPVIVVKSVKDKERLEKCGIRLKNAMTECNVKEKDMAKDLNYTVQYLSQLRNGKKPITRKLAKEFAGYLNKRHEPQRKLAFVDSLPSEQQKKYRDAGYDDDDMVETEKTEDYYAPSYFTGDIDQPNGELYAMQDLNSARKSRNEFNKHFTPVIRSILKYVGYELVSPSVLTSSLIPYNSDGMLNAIHDVIEFYGNDEEVNYMVLREIATDKEITLSLREAAALFDTFCHSMGTILDGLFLSRDADDDSSENAPDLGKT